MLLLHFGQVFLVLDHFSCACALVPLLKNRHNATFHLNGILLINVMVLLLDGRLFVQEILLLRVFLRYSQVAPTLPVWLWCGGPKYRAAAHERQRALLMVLADACLRLVEGNSQVVSPLYLSGICFVVDCFLHVGVLWHLAELGPRALLAIQVSVAQDELFILYRVIVFIYFCPTLSFGTEASLEQFLFVQLQLTEERWSHLQILPP